MIPKKQPIGISIIIPNFNGQTFLPPCLRSLISSIKLCPSTNFEILLVDNGSTDSSRQIFNKISVKFKKILSFQLLTLDCNYGFATAVNHGIKASRFDYVCVCNNDLTVDKLWFKVMSSVIIQNTSKTVNQLTNGPVTTFFGLVLNKNGTKVESRGLRFYPYGKAENIDNGLPHHQSKIPATRFSKRSKHQHPNNHQIWGASASIVIYHKPTLLKVGLFDEKFFAFIEDVDLSYRLDKAGYKTLFVSQAISYHLGGGTAGKNSFFRKKLTYINWIRFIIKNYTITEIIVNLPGILQERLLLLYSFIR